MSTSNSPLPVFEILHRHHSKHHNVLFGARYGSVLRDLDMRPRHSRGGSGIRACASRT